MGIIQRTVVACVGSSSTAGKGQAFDWIGTLAHRPRNSRFAFNNFGVGGDLAYNALQRLPAILACRPDKVVIWIGGNDVLALVFPKFRFFLRLFKRLLRNPSPEWFHECLSDLARKLKSQTSATLALCSLAPIGEALDSTHPVQCELNRRTAQYSAIVADIARAEGCHYLPLYETMKAELMAAPGKAFTAFRFLPFYRDALLTVVLRHSADELAREHGWRLHSDGVHLNSRGGRIAVDLVQRFLDGTD